MRVKTSKYNGVYFQQYRWSYKFGFNRQSLPNNQWYIVIEITKPIKRIWRGSLNGYFTEREAAIAADKIYIELKMYHKLNILKPKL